MGIICNSSVVSVSCDTDTITIDTCHPIVTGGDVPTTGITLGEDVGAKLVIAVVGGLGFLADKDTVAHTNASIGLSSVSGLTSAVINVQTGDDISEVTWSWDLTKPIFLGNSGVLTQTVPTTGFSLIVGKPISATSLLIDIDLPIVLVV